MIKVNLAKRKRKFQMPIVLGMDLGKINLKGVIIFIIAHYVILGALESLVQDEKDAKTQEIQALRQTRQALQVKTRKNRDIQKQIDDLAKREEVLKERRRIVESIIKSKKNPYKLMLYVAENIPEDVWIDNLELANDEIKIEGESLSYKSIGLFIENLRSSIYFSENFRFGGSETLVDEVTGKRREKFSLSGKVVRYF